MDDALESIRVVGIHQVEPTQEMLDVYDFVWGTDKVAREVRSRHFGSLYLIEIEAQPAHAKIDWIKITQPIHGQPNSEWQAPWDERMVDSGTGHWAFFMHFLNPNAPLHTPIGDVNLPPATPIPSHLSNIRYELPG